MASDAAHCSCSETDEPLAERLFIGSSGRPYRGDHAPADDSLLLIRPLADCPALRPWRALHRAAAPGAVLPLVLHLHGGAFIGGALPQAAPRVAHLLADAGAVVVSLDYPLAPGHPFPQPAKPATRR